MLRRRSTLGPLRLAGRSSVLTSQSGSAQDGVGLHSGCCSVRVAANPHIPKPSRKRKKSRLSYFHFYSSCHKFFRIDEYSCSGCSSVLLQHPVDPVSGGTVNGLGGAAEVPDAAVPRLALQSLGGAVTGQAVQAVGATVPGLRLVVEARQASVGQPVVCGPETGGSVSETRRNKHEHQEQILVL